MSKSKQINFFIVPDDIAEIANFLKENDCIILKSKLENPKDIFDYDIVTNTEKIYQVYLVKKGFRDRLEFNYAPSKDYYYLDILKSDAIDFSLGGFYPYSNKELHRSRFYYIYEYFENATSVTKNPLFISWADELFKAFKKRFLRKAPNHSQVLLTDKCLKWINANEPSIKSGGDKMVVE